jgi:hypothetical protein
MSVRKICRHSNNNTKHQWALLALISFSVIVAIAALSASGCGGGSRGTGSFGLDGTRPPALVNDAGQILRDSSADILVQATPTPKQR